MKANSKFVLAAFAATAMFATAGCSTDSKKDNPPPTPQQQVNNKLTTERTSYVDQTQTRIDQLTKYSTDLRTHADQAQKPQNKKLENAADDMDSLLSDARKSLSDVKTSAPENWIDYKRDVEKSMDRAESEYSNTVHLLE